MSGERRWHGETAKLNGIDDGEEHSSMAAVHTNSAGLAATPPLPAATRVRCHCRASSRRQRLVVVPGSRCGQHQRHNNTVNLSRAFDADGAPGCYGGPRDSHTCHSRTAVLQYESASGLSGRSLSRRRTCIRAMRSRRGARLCVYVRAWSSGPSALSGIRIPARRSRAAARLCASVHVWSSGFSALPGIRTPAHCKQNDARLCASASAPSGGPSAQCGIHTPAHCRQTDAPLCAYERVPSGCSALLPGIRTPAHYRRTDARLCAYASAPSGCSSLLPGIRILAHCRRTGARLCAFAHAPSG